MAEHEQQAGNVQIKASDDILKGAYANMAAVSHSPSGEEFVMDFMSVFPPAGMLVSRVYMSPGHYKRLLQAMQEQVKKYEDQFGTITPAAAADHKFGFRTE